MYILERKIVWQLLLLIFAVPVVGAELPKITLSELRQIVTDSRKSATTAHLVYIEELNNNRSIDSNENNIESKIEKIRKHKRIKVDTIFNCKTKGAKISITDLRDIDALLKEYNIPPVQKSVVSWSRTTVIQQPYEMELLGIDVSDSPPDLILSRCSGVNYTFGLISLGIIRENLLSEDLTPTLSEINLDGQSLLRIELTKKEQNATKVIIKIDCDPSLGYRFRRIQWNSDGQLIKETIADDYRDVNDGNGVVPYPFMYIDRSFDKDGRISKETKYVMEKVQMGVDLSADDFKIFVPVGTSLLDSVVSMTTHKIEQSGYIGINDALSIGTKGQLK